MPGDLYVLLYGVCHNECEIQPQLMRTKSENQMTEIKYAGERLSVFISCCKIGGKVRWFREGMKWEEEKSKHVEDKISASIRQVFL